MNEVIWDAFISHASEDKEEVALPLSKALMAAGLKIWLDKSEISLGDSLREKIDEGLANSQFGIVILSHNFFSKDWPKSEIDGLYAREIGGDKVILPVWHKISFEEIKGYSPLLAGKFAVSTSEGLSKVKNQIISAIHKVGRKESIGKPVYSGKLTKKAVMEFEEGSFLVSNCYSSFDRRPLIEEKVGSVIDRESLWKKAKSRGADGRLCSVFRKHEDYVAHARSLESLMYRDST
ncbi:toll/interleukin-1 receptor domain-containing protein [Marichromatium sp. AB32]|uniref:toll/interleukin-1 receptor domain-containing protein n=1 Tax=Marichromatium sp. AB32 TaxID=2483363 RepID=UPI000F3DF415|nr:toll/interleukin-1 receptor domain-containing protein [Marichromatium sp. AB32]RNE90727.1 toll/interleukin-1 receptor domain-containing protein [Marichromatium sp. AB32]